MEIQMELCPACGNYSIVFEKSDDDEVIIRCTRCPYEAS